MSIRFNFQQVAAGAFSMAILSVLFGLSVPVALTARQFGVRGLAQNFPRKQFFLECNGGSQLLQLRRMCNNRVKLSTGGLGFFSLKVPDFESKAIAEVSFSKWLAGLGVPFIHVQAPTGVDKDGAVLPEGVVNEGNSRAEEYVRRLASDGVETVNLIPRYTSSVSDIERYFCSDHHWNYDAAFDAAGLIVRRLLARLGEDEGLARRLDRKHWKRSERKRWRRGSHGARTGCLFSGVDDLMRYEPRFRTNLLRVEYGGNGIPSRHAGPFVKSMIAKRIWNEKAPFSRGIFSLHPRTLSRCDFFNDDAPCKKKILLIGDSFARPVPAYLLAVFRKVIYVDPRKYCEVFPAGLRAFVSEAKPDAVIQLCNPTTLDAELGDNEMIPGSRHAFEYGPRTRR